MRRHDVAERRATPPTSIEAAQSLKGLRGFVLSGGVEGKLLHSPSDRLRMVNGRAHMEVRESNFPGPERRGMIPSLEGRLPPPPKNKITLAGWLCFLIRR